MKTQKQTLVIMAMAIMAVAVAVVSCKKDNNNAGHQDGTTSQAKNYRQIEDKLAYITDFKKKMVESKDDESFNLDDAAWHLACLANVDFCNINVKYDDFLFDTIALQVNVANGVMLLSDLSMAYEQMHDAIQQYKKGFSRCNQNMYYVNVSIDAGGVARIALMTSFMNNSKEPHTWFFANAFVAAYACDTLFFDDSTYCWNDLAARELKRILNTYVRYENDTLPDGTIHICYVPTRDHTFDYTNTYDPYDNDYYYINSSRVFAKKYYQPYPDYALSVFEMCYCLDSYLGLGYDYIADNLYTDEHPVCWTVNPRYMNPNHMHYYFHKLHVEYGQPISNPNPND